jgi:hypothetical protein
MHNQTKTKTSWIVEAYECVCGHIMPKYTESYGYFPAMPYFAFHSCCRECGATRNEIKTVTGKWTWTYQVFKWWTFKPDKEISKVFNHSNYSLEKEIEELKKKGA